MSKFLLKQSRALAPGSPASLCCAVPWPLGLLIADFYFLLSTFSSGVWQAGKKVLAAIFAIWPRVAVVVGRK